MKYFIIGDIHGCYYTLRKMLDEYWDPSKEKLMFLGDYVNKGKHTFAVLEYLMELDEKMHDQIILLKGNNEYLFEKYYRDSITLATKQKFEMYDLNYVQVLDWMNQLPHFYDNDKIFLSHAGVGTDVDLPLSEDNIDVIFNRKDLVNINKRQFVGHIVVDKPTYDKKANAWYIDTGAGHGQRLTGAKVEVNGDISEFVILDINQKDIARFN